MERRDARAWPDEVDLAPEQTAPAVPPFTITRRRVAMLVGGLFAIWLIGVFARQVGEASTAANQADQLRSRNAAMESDVNSLQQEIALIEEPAFAAQMARGYTLGNPGEVPVAVDPNAPALPANAPGSVGIKPQQTTQTKSPLESWLEAIFGSN